MHTMASKVQPSLLLNTMTTGISLGEIWSLKLTSQRRRLLLPSSSSPSSWNTRTQRAVFWIGTLLITKRQRGNREMGRAKREPGKDVCQLFLQSLHLRLLGASLHPALPPWSSSAAQGLLQQRKTPLMVQTERSVCVLTTESLSLQTVYEFTSALPSLFLFSS